MNSTDEQTTTVCHVVAMPFPGQEWLGFIGSDPKPDNIRFETIPNVIPSERSKPPIFRASMKLGPVVDDVGVRVFHVHYFDLHIKQSHAKIDLIVEQEEKIAGISSSNVEELRTIFYRDDRRVLELALDCISRVPQAQYLLFTSVFEFEPQVFDSLRATYNFPVYPIGPAIPYLELRQGSCKNKSYLQWLDFQPAGSVLYISLGSFLSVSNTQMDEIVAGLHISGVRYCTIHLWGFWTHCGWNSILEAVFAGVPMLTFPLFLDQDTNSRQIVEDWGNGWRVNSEKLVTKENVAQLARRLMDAESNEGKKIRRAAKQLQDKCLGAISEGGSSAANLDAFINSISLGKGQ
ncbi:putative UDP-Glycosyltransferase superfamily protein [Hibiscus syriacus]|uniref:UDP-Glycosyltransferase superfamily protein n=1 Tax=Hibiscus syriacus TaxID=106335 RepID=A0A6A3B2C7_HIBSY|nr:putative UDP-Glycosyltransferase superfamily protein [Hibiscus syriacus]